MLTTFYELRAQGPEGAVHCLLELEHLAGADARLCWLAASLQAHEVLQRMPTATELRPLSVKAAHKLTRPSA